MQRRFNDDDYGEEFEPRITPKPATKIENFTVSSVPEVSLILDKPIENRNLKPVVSDSPSFNKHASYAAWRQHNFSKTSNYKVDETNNSQKVQYDYSYNPVTSVQRNNDSCDNDNKIRKRDVHTHKREQDHSRPRTLHNYSCNTTSAKSHNRSKDYSDCNERTRLSSNPKQNIDAYYDNHSYNLNIPSYPSTSKQDLVIPNCMQAQVNANNTESYPQAHNLTTPNVYPNNQFPPISHPGYPYPRFDMSTYPFPSPFYPMHHHNSTESQETIKNLLQLVNAQREQIQSLQSQVDNLLKMQKEFLMDKKKCICSSQTVQQNGYIHTESIDASNYQTAQNQKVKRNACQSTNVIERNVDNGKDIRIRNQPELLLSEQHADKGVMEQQVSIGVMTSFEFTVQNNPIVVDYEDHQKEELQQNDPVNRQNNKHLQETCETLKRNCFTRLPVGQLENIVEDSESYLSSSQPHSSNYNISCSMKDLQDKRIHVDNQNPRNVPVDKIDRFSQPNKNVYQDSNKMHTQKQQYSSTDYEKQRIKKEDTERFFNKDAALSPYNYEHCGTNDVINNQNKYAETKNENKCDNSDGFVKTHRRVEDSLVLSSGDFKINPPPVTPEPSIHVDMQEYSSDEESDKIKRTSKVGWTFYNKVLGQVNQILQNSSTVDPIDPKDVKTRHNVEQDEIENQAILDNVKVATLEQLRKLGISLVDKPESMEKIGTRKVEFDSSFYPRLDYQANITRATSGITERNTSMHMEALALKYLSNEQLAELTTQKQGSASLKQVMLSNMQGTNLSFATMRYLERYQLLPGKNNLQVEDDNLMCLEGSLKADLETSNVKHNLATQQYPYTQVPRTNYPGKILDISTLKQMPKLL